MPVRYINKIIRNFLIKFKDYYLFVIIINAFCAVLTFIIIIINVLTAVRLRINNNYYFKVFFININEL